MKILDLCDFYSERGGGVRSYLEKLARIAPELGHEVVIVAPGPRDEETELGPSARLVRYGSPRMPYDPTYHLPVRLGRMRELVREHRPDVLQASSPFAPALLTALDRSSQVRSYVHHADPIGCYLEPLAARVRSPGAKRLLLGPAWAWLRSVTRFCDVTVVAGSWLERQLKQQRCQHVRAVPFGIEHADFGPERRDPELRRQLLGSVAAESEARLFLIAGRLAADKRQARLVDALLEVSRRRPTALLVLGDGPERDRLKERARGLAQATFLKFTKNRSEYAAILASVDALIHGSMCETYGFVLAETLASGTPIVVPDRGGALHLGRPECAETYPAFGSASDVAGAIDRLMDRSTEDLRAAARLAGKEQPSTRDHFQNLFNLYASLLAA